MKKLLILSLVCICLHQVVIAQEFTQGYFTKQEMKQDLQFLKEKLSKVHPKFLIHEFSKEWQVKYDSILTLLPDSISEVQNFVLLSELVSYVEDDHTGILFPYTLRQDYMNNGGITMPFGIKIKKERLFIHNYLAKKKAKKMEGVELLSINSIDSKKLLQDIRTLVGVKNGTAGDASVERFFAICFWMLYGEAEQFKLKTASPKLHVKCDAIDKTSYFELKNKKYPPKTKEAFTLEFTEDNEFARIKISSFYDATKLASFLRTAFATIEQNKCENLIIDVKDNAGGRSSAVDSLLNYLISEPYQQYLSIHMRPSIELKEKYKESKPETYKLLAGIPSNELYNVPDSLLMYNPRKNTSPYTGRVFVHINGRTNSAAATFAGAVRKYKLGKLIGESTGGTIIYHGDFLNFSMPQSKLKFVVSAKRFHQFGYRRMGEHLTPDLVLKLKNEELPVLVKFLKMFY